ncbi:MAG: FG-GAP-like repeat-containing protein [Deltaproteobacteria bacterium]|nr:FG-GAP-like repeat-containing protein [Deltaproteobacteria bacterium]
MENYSPCRVSCLCILFSFLLSFIPAHAAEKHSAVAFLPFTVNASKDMSYLRDGLGEMLASRLSAEAGVVAVDKKIVNAALGAGGKVDPNQVEALAGKMGADYLLYGSVTSLGGGMSFDARVYSTATKSSETFYATAVKEGDVMTAIDNLAWSVLEKTFGKKRPGGGAAPQAAVADAELGALQTAHPDRTFRASAGLGNSSLLWSEGSSQFFKTRNVPLSLEGMSIGDVDGDGLLEVVMADREKVIVYKLNAGRLVEFAQIKPLARYKIHAVNVADLNGNGKAEIYISAADSTMPGSMGVEWNGKEFATLFDDARYYIRPVKVPGLGVVLAGQKAGPEGVAISGPIYILSQEGSQLVGGERLPVPAGVNIFDFAFADLDGDGEWEVVVIDKWNKLLVMKQSGKVLWKSEERYGATKRFIGGMSAIQMTQQTGPSRGVTKMADGGTTDILFEKTYIPSRILVTDVDGDGVDDIIINANTPTWTSLVRSSQIFESGTMIGMKWNGVGLQELWRTRKIGGYVVDYDARSHHLPLKDGVEQLYVGVVAQGNFGDVLTADESMLLVYPLQFKAPEK